MRPKCPVCGKLFWCDYPNLWRYKREKTYLCSWGCLRKYDERKEAKDMAYSKIKKDGTPAKKPTGKKTAAQALQELKEDFAEKGVELVYDPDIAEEYRREQAQKKANEEARKEAEEEMNRPKIFSEIDMVPLQICAVRSRAKESASFMIADNGGMYLMNSKPWLLTKEEWQMFSAEILMALYQLEIEK